MLKAGVPGFQCFLKATGVEDFSHVCLQDLHIAMNELQGTDCVLLVRVWAPTLPFHHPF